MTIQPSLGRPDAVAVESAAAQVLTAGLLHGDSAFTPGEPIWTSAHLGELRAIARPGENIAVATSVAGAANLAG